MEFNGLNPIRGFVLLVDDQPEYTEAGGIVVRKEEGCYHMDFTVAKVHPEDDADFGAGDTVIVRDPNVGRRVAIGDVVHRLVSLDDVIAVREQ